MAHPAVAARPAVGTGRPHLPAGRAYFKLEQFASLPPASEETEETPAELAWPEVDFTALAAVNPDVTAWLYGPDTGIQRALLCNAFASPIPRQAENV